MRPPVRRPVPSSPFFWTSERVLLRTRLHVLFFSYCAATPPSAQCRRRFFFWGGQRGSPASCALLMSAAKDNGGGRPRASDTAAESHAVSATAHSEMTTPASAALDGGAGATAAGPAPAIAPNSFVARVSSIPAVTTAVHKITSIYETSKASNSLIKVRWRGLPWAAAPAPAPAPADVRRSTGMRARNPHTQHSTVRKRSSRPSRPLWARCRR